MKHLLKGDKARKGTKADVEANVVECIHATVHSSLGKEERFEMIWNLSFEDMTQAEILEAAAEHFIIKIRRVFAKVSKPTNDDWNNTSFKVKGYVSARTSQVERDVHTIQAASDEMLLAAGLTVEMIEALRAQKSV